MIKQLLSLTTLCSITELHAHVMEKHVSEDDIISRMTGTLGVRSPRKSHKVFVLNLILLINLYGFN